MVRKKNILIVIGTRPEAIKMAPVFLELKKHDVFLNVQIVSTGQHKSLVAPVLDFFNITLNQDLAIMKEGQDLFDVTINCLSSLKSALLSFKPDLVLVHGDTSTSMAAALAANYLHIKVGHVEAGLRTFNKASPFPEELNRRINACLSDIHFPPTIANKNNLLTEGIPADRIFVSGNTVVDALLLANKKIHKNNNLKGKIEKYFEERLNFDFMQKQFLIVTTHRRENFGAGLEQIFESLLEIADQFPGVSMVFPIHPNPNVVGMARKLLSSKKNINLINPLPYEHFVYLLSRCRAVLTDSGGIQEEAPTFEKPTIVLREVTERREALETGLVSMVGANKKLLVETVTKILGSGMNQSNPEKNKNPFGNGTAAEFISQVIMEQFVEQ